VHAAYLFKQYDIGHYLVQRYPDLPSQPYESKFSSKSKTYIEECNEKLKQLLKLRGVDDDEDHEDLNKRMPYSGENILHIVIV